MPPKANPLTPLPNKSNLPAGNTAPLAGFVKGIGGALGSAFNSVIKPPAQTNPFGQPPKSIAQTLTPQSGASPFSMGQTAKAPGSTTPPAPNTLPTGQANPTPKVVAPPVKVTPPAAPAPTAPVATPAPQPGQAGYVPPNVAAANASMAQNGGVAPSAQSSNTTPNAQNGSPVGVPSGLANSGLYGSLIANGLNDANRAVNLNQALNLGENAVTKQPIPLAFQQGQAAALQRDYGAQALAANQGAGYELQGAGMVKPEAGVSFFSSPISGGLVGSGNSLLDNAVAQATQLVQNRTSPSDPAVTSLLSPFGTLGAQAFTAAMQGNTGGTYNPTSQSASSQQTASQAATYGGQAKALSVALQQLGTLKPVVTNFLASSGINPTDSQTLNAPVNTYIGTLGNQANVAYAAMQNELQNFSSQILQAGTALTPTGVTEATALQNPGTLSYNQINTYLSDLEGIGSNKYNVLSSAAKASGYTGDMGTPVAPTTTSVPSFPASTAPAGGLTNPVAQGATALGLDAAGGIGGLFSTAAGSAAKLFGLAEVL